MRLDVRNKWKKKTIIWRLCYEDPKKARLVVLLPREQPVTEVELKEIENLLKRFTKNARKSPTKIERFRIGDVLGQIRSKNLRLFPVEQVDYFLEKINFSISHSWPRKITEADLAEPFAE